MSCKLVETKKGKIAFAVYRGDSRKWIGTEMDWGDVSLRAQAERLADAVTAEMGAGTFTDDRFLFWFPGSQYAAEIRRRREVERPAVTLEQYTRDWLQRRTPPLVRPSLHRAYKTHLGAINDATSELDGRAVRVGTLAVRDIEARHIEALRAVLLGSGARGRRSVKSVKNMLGATLRRMLRDALAVDHLLVADPFAALRGTWPRVVMPPPDPFTRDERDALLEWFRCNATQHHATICTMFLTGMRPSELAGLRWGDVDLGAGKVTIQRSRIRDQVEATKTAASTRTIRVVDAVREAIAGLQPLRPDPDAYVFTGAGGRPLNQANLQKRDWSRGLQKLKIRPRKLYATRATFISLALSNNAPAKGIAEYVGSSLAMLQRSYARYMGDPDQILGAIDAPRPATTTSVAGTGSASG